MGRFQVSLFILSFHHFFATSILSHENFGEFKDVIPNEKAGEGKPFAVETKTTVLPVNPSPKSGEKIWLDPDHWDPKSSIYIVAEHDHNGAIHEPAKVLEENGRRVIKVGNKESLDKALEAVKELQKTQPDVRVIFSGHSTNGATKMGENFWIDEKNVEEIGRKLLGVKDVFFDGCSFGGGPQGEKVMTALSRVSGAHVWGNNKTTYSYEYASRAETGVTVDSKFVHVNPTVLAGSTKGGKVDSSLIALNPVMGTLKPKFGIVATQPAVVAGNSPNNGVTGSKPNATPSSTAPAGSLSAVSAAVAGVLAHTSAGSGVAASLSKVANPISASVLPMGSASNPFSRDSVMYLSEGATSTGTSSISPSKSTGGGSNSGGATTQIPFSTGVAGISVPSGPQDRLVVSVSSARSTSSLDPLSGKTLVWKPYTFGLEFTSVRKNIQVRKTRASIGH